MWKPLLILALLSAPVTLRAADSPLNPIAAQYVKAVLALDPLDKGYVDSYDGPEEWKTQAESKKLQLPDLKTVGAQLLEQMNQLQKKYADSKNPEHGRYVFLKRQIEAFNSRIEILSGKKMSFDEESKALYDAVAPPLDEEHNKSIIAQLDKVLPGTGSLSDRFSAFKAKFKIPKDKLQGIIELAIAECRKKTKKYVDLPESENFKLEFVTDKPWAGYNWYKGKYQSIIQINVDKPVSPERALDIAAHEGYPGHHVLNSIFEKELLNKKGWVEYSISPLYSPAAFIMEGTATLALDVAFPKAERAKFLKTVLFPMAGFDPAQVDSYLQIQNLLRELAPANIEANRRYLDGKMTRVETKEWLKKYDVQDDDGAEGNLKFADSYRSYVVNYSLGNKLIKKYLEKKVGKNPSEKALWTTFIELLKNPRPASSFQ